MLVPSYATLRGIYQVPKIHQIANFGKKNISVHACKANETGDLPKQLIELSIKQETLTHEELNFLARNFKSLENLPFRLHHHFRFNLVKKVDEHVNTALLNDLQSLLQTKSISTDDAHLILRSCECAELTVNPEHPFVLSFWRGTAEKGPHFFKEVKRVLSSSQNLAPGLKELVEAGKCSIEFYCDINSAPRRLVKLDALINDESISAGIVDYYQQYKDLRRERNSRIVESYAKSTTSSTSDGKKLPTSHMQTFEHLKSTCPRELIDLLYVTLAENDFNVNAKDMDFMLQNIGLLEEFADLIYGPKISAQRILTTKVSKHLEDVIRATDHDLWRTGFINARICEGKLQLSFRKACTVMDDGRTSNEPIKTLFNELIQSEKLSSRIKSMIINKQCEIKFYSANIKNIPKPIQLDKLDEIKVPFSYRLMVLLGDLFKNTLA